MKPDSPWQLLIDKADPTRTLTTSLPVDAPGPGDILVRLDRFAVTANTITYVLLGKSFNIPGQVGGYWDFFPPRGDVPAGDWGVVPVWGIGTVVASAHPVIAVGEEVYGYWPFASHAVLTVGKVGQDALQDATPHRASLPAAYGEYQRLGRMTPGDVGRKDLWPVYRPLLATGFLISDQLEAHADYGAARVVFASASSKTAMLTAHCLRRRRDCPHLVALTSARSVAVVEATGLYDQVLSYDAIETLDPTIPTAYVDMAGDDGVIRRVHSHLRDVWRFGLLVGKSHAQAKLTPTMMANAGMVPFFAPTRLRMRAGDWGADGLRERLSDAWISFGARADSIASLETHVGAAAAAELYGATLAGRTDPRLATIVDPSPVQ